MSSKKTRRAAVARGLEVRGVVRLVQVSRDGGRSWHVGDASCVEYTLRHAGSSSYAWSCLQRASHADPLPGYQFEYRGDRDPTALRSTLISILSDASIDGELFEFEGDDNRTSVYWMEWGGEPFAIRVAAYLAELARSMW